jgi:thioredoxin 1
MAIIEVDEDNFKNELSFAFERKDSVVLKFGSTYCDACMALGFELEELDEKLNNFTVLEIDCSTSETLAEEYDIIQVPTMKIYKDKESLIFDGVGVVLAADILEILEN